MNHASARGNFSIALGGDCMLTRRLAIFDEPEFLALRRRFCDCDAGFVNLETVVRRWDEGAPGVTRGTYMTTPPELLEDLRWFGVNLVSCANNHAFDYGEGGLLATLDHLDRAGVVHAGAGRNLAEARGPAYLDTKGGRVALVATTATFREWNRAGAQRADIGGRPGINPFRATRTYTVDAAAFDSLKRLSRELGFEQTRARDRTHFFSDKEIGADGPEALTLFGETFVRGDAFALSTEGERRDVEDHLRQVREARRQADWVVVSFHSHDFGQASLLKAKTKVELHEPADYARAFARAAIDAGADIFVGHGSHTPLGVDFHRGKPIFYSVGNLIFQNETVPFFPEEAYGRFGLGADATPADFLEARTGGGSKGHVAHREFWENMAATCHFVGGRLDRVELIPIEQGFGLSRGQRGRPLLASGEAAARILDRAARLSEPFGVKVTVENGVGVARPPS
jgi:poly-gamma-glutamate capsule biosynthesis protein CapA/YwtB (metallophosphatase superfamily)